ncbi:hypothetical protein [Nocardioides sp. NPDC006303]|uniref:hypothetical protein n=1 Tax=Nocardioides sp. NPDC006303 TaxID=3156747 RepID=UPI0033BCB6F3
MIAFGVAGCGGSDEAQTPSITKPKELFKDVALSYDSRTAATKPKRVEVAQGQMVVIAVISDVPGIVSVEGHNVERDVRAKEVSTLVISADASGSYDVTMKGKGVDTHLAELEVTK